MEYTIITYGGGETLFTLFNAIAALLNSKTGSLYQPLIRFGLTIGIFWATAAALYGERAKFITKWMLPFYMILTLFFAPTCRVHIQDPVSHQPPYTVDHVPWGLGAFAGTLSKMGDSITREIEKTFTLPDDLKYHKTGSLFASTLIAESKVFHITSPEIQETLREFVNQCVIYDALLGKKYTLTELKHTDDLWGLVTREPSPARSFVFKAPGKRARILSCREGVQKLDRLINQEIQNAFQFLGNKVFGVREDARQSGHNLINPSREIQKYLPFAFGYMGKMAKDASEIMKQQMMIYSLMDGIESKSTTLGNASNFAIRRAYLQERANQETLAGVAAQKLVAMKNIMEALLYAAFIFILPMALLPQGWKFISRWAGLLLWIQLWAPLYAVLNFLMQVALRSKSLGILNEEGFTIATSVGFSNLHADMGAQAGFLTIAVGSLAYALVKGGAGSFVHLASHLASPSIQAAGRASEDLVSGNYSFGNITEGTLQAHNSTFGQQLLSPSYNSGSFTQNDGLISRTTTADGTHLVNIASSNLRSSINVSESLSQSYQEQANVAETASINHMVASATSQSEAYRNVIDLASHQAKSTSSGENFTESLSSNESKALNDAYRLTEKFAQDHSISFGKASQIIASASASVEASAGINILGTGATAKATAALQAQSSWDTRDQDLFSKAKDYVKESGLQKSLAQASNYAKEGKYSSLDDEGQRYSQSIGSSLEKAKSHREEASAQHQLSESYSKSASSMKQIAATWNTNLSQPYIDWLSDQSLPNSEGPMGRREAAVIASSRPELDMAFQQRFIEEKIKSRENHMERFSSQQDIKGVYEKSEEAVKMTPLGESMEVVREKASTQGFGEDFTLNQKPKEQVGQKLDETTGQLEEEEGRIHKEGEQFGEKVKSARFMTNNPS